MAREPARTTVELPWGLGSAHIPEVEQPGLLESMIPVWGPGKAAVADYQDGDYGGAAVNAGLAALDLVPQVALAKVATKGAKIMDAGVSGWSAVRKRYGRAGVVGKNVDMHHAIISRNGPIGRYVPDRIKNQLWNLTPLDRVTHGRISHKVGEAPRFGFVKRTWIGSPPWAKAQMAAGAARTPQAVENQWLEKR